MTTYYCDCNEYENEMIQKSGCDFSDPEKETIFYECPVCGKQIDDTRRDE